tara:strand:+ start:7430 stop:7732 length:303 start_codon:yes stop_codon:yes gene_type:complete
MIAHELRRLAEENEDTFPGWFIPVAVLVCLILMITCLVCCTVRCFSPEQTKGPLWTTTEQGEAQLVRPATHDGHWLQKVVGNDGNSIYKDNPCLTPQDGV